MTKDAARYEAAPPPAITSLDVGAVDRIAEAIVSRAVSQKTVDEVAAFEQASISSATRRGYASDLRQFQRWLHGYREGDEANATELALTRTCPRRPVDVANFLTEKAAILKTTGERRYSPTTMARWVAAINWEHTSNGLPAIGKDPRVVKVLTGIRREHHRPVRRAAPLLIDDLRKTILATDIKSFPGGVRGTRDAALLIFGFAGAFRRSEIAAFTFGDVFPHEEDGLHIRIRSSKTDQEGRGDTVALPYGQNSATCAPCAVRRWQRLLRAQNQGRPAVMAALRAQNIAIHICREEPGEMPFPRAEPVFRAMAKSGLIREAGMSGSAIAAVIKERVGDAGLRSEFMSGHSLRSGFVTQALRSGASAHEIMRQTRHANPATIETYAREHAPLQGNAAVKVGM